MIDIQLYAIRVPTISLINVTMLGLVNNFTTLRRFIVDETR